MKEVLMLYWVGLSHFTNFTCSRDKGVAWWRHVEIHWVPWYDIQPVQTLLGLVVRRLVEGLTTLHSINNIKNADITLNLRRSLSFLS
jgi:hypothetical protein